MTPTARVELTTLLTLALTAAVLLQAATTGAPLWLGAAAAGATLTYTQARHAIPATAVLTTAARWTRALILGVAVVAAATVVIAREATR